MNLRTLGNSSVLAVALTYGLLLRLAFSAGLFGFLLAVLVLLSLWRYAYAVLRGIAQGRTSIPPPGPETMNPVGELTLIVHFGLFFAALYFLATTPLFGAGWFVALLRWSSVVLLVMVFPASAALMGFTGNSAAALNPSNIAGVIGTMGRSYARLVIACIGLLLFTQLASALLGSSSLALLFRDIVAVWGFLGIFTLIGAALREHSADFAIPGRVAPEEWQQRDRQRGWQQTLDRAYGSIRGGLVAEGYRTIKELLAAENDSVEAYQWAFNSMLTWQDQTHALQLAPRFIERLIDAGREHSALELVGQCRKLARDFAVPPESAARLADYARALGRHGAADELAVFSPRVPTP